ncbi:hypothetical protein GCM10017600_83700 [Streptosporangium carneum]|uniref:Uncharacterized protein n=1 Tax=Streptosporangium carneum TaxID=47481 RepID=A0A9W6IA93_9ACTN|nr:hypothetical protein GCM10017600_83700 [Streptosporangium carneum]
MVEVETVSCFSFGPYLETPEWRQELERWSWKAGSLLSTAVPVLLALLVWAVAIRGSGRPKVHRRATVPGGDLDGVMRDLAVSPDERIAYTRLLPGAGEVLRWPEPWSACLGRPVNGRLPEVTAHGEASCGARSACTGPTVRR